MAYVDVKGLYKEEIGVYCRVSTSGQNINQQISLAEIYFAQKDINLDKVQYFLDDNVSANKLTSEQRPQLQLLIAEIKKGIIRTVIVQNRDRLARNFYEYIELVKIFYKYDVEIIFTDSSQALFSRVLSVESLYGIFSQSEGKNIARRTNLAAAQFPNSLLGFNVTGQRNTKKYTPKPEIKNEIRSLFYSIIDVNSAEKLIEIFMRHKKVFKNNLKLLKSLKNPFYAGYIKIQEQYVHLPHVEPIISLEDYLKVQERLSKFEREIQVSIAKSNKTALLHPICCICKTPMNFRSSELGGSSYYVCSKGHPRNFIDVARYNQLILKHLTYVLSKIDVKEIKKDVFKCLLDQEKYCKQQLAYEDNQLSSIHIKIIELLGTNNRKKLNLLTDQSKKTKEVIKQINTNLIKIEEARNNTNYFVAMVKEQLSTQLEKYQKEYLINLLFLKIEVSSDAVLYHITFGKYIERTEESNEY